ncbi:16S rRNA (guanine(966)-N(2))-methyltransferase RsmD [Pseudoprimorskyibacter insulae]|uniref:Ribosomal RNA small subunit methyltransferase D n=1 Tax=Pseudoprimorskyibacter insulae TaxID=1695997 RepID=A0A2R8ANT7_9RHOB|nr:16S rRNA (guanine(966)-N(2))-methyltransferase RsmD [Pseudoprimorskyibacter insulae]SPF77524.1 Ribosomal RNA small subunit methyltransferase D [Pseudoprimorskyibacter insulae]
MRIVAGRFRGRRLAAVGKGDAGAHLRPTTDRVRESLFSMLQGGRFGDPFDGTRVLDLFAGTGALGLEALSRGAAHVTFVDDGRKSLTLIRQNIKELAIGDEAEVIARDALRLPPASAPCQLVFLDPPYGKALGEKALLAAKAQGWIDQGALIVFEENAAQPAPDGFDLLECKRYGDTHITFLEAQ